MKRIVLASGNSGKLREIKDVLASVPVELLPQSDFDVVEVDETGLSFVENALIKARHACEATGLPAIADDSGIEVDVLDGEPGIYSARYAGPAATDADNNARLLRQMAGVPAKSRTARFQCLLVYLRHARDPTPLICQGTWEGQILHEARGENGFGYDPLFHVSEYGCSSAQLAPDVKNEISHRGQALKQFQNAFAKYL